MIKDINEKDVKDAKAQKSITKLDIEKRLHRVKYPCSQKEENLLTGIVQTAYDFGLFNIAECRYWLDKIQDVIVVQIVEGKFKGMEGEVHFLDSQNLRKGVGYVRVRCDGILHSIAVKYLKIIFQANNFN